MRRSHPVMWTLLVVTALCTDRATARADEAQWSNLGLYGATEPRLAADADGIHVYVGVSVGSPGVFV